MPTVNDRRCPCGEFAAGEAHHCPWAAKLIVQDADTMTRSQLREVADWLHEQADSLVERGRAEYDTTYTARKGLKK